MFQDRSNSNITQEQRAKHIVDEVMGKNPIDPLPEFYNVVPAENHMKKHPKIG